MLQEILLDSFSSSTKSNVFKQREKSELTSSKRRKQRIIQAKKKTKGIGRKNNARIKWLKKQIPCKATFKPQNSKIEEQVKSGIIGE